MQNQPVAVAVPAEERSGPGQEARRTRLARGWEGSGTDGGVSLERSLKHVHLKLRKFKDMKK